MSSSPGPLKNASIEEKIRMARAMFEAAGSLLGADPQICRLLEETQRKIEASQRAMFDTGIVAACTRCDAEEGGSCCGAGIENRYTPVLLLVNLLLGVRLPEARLSSNSCFFLGERGCSLKARHILCINYLCTRLQKETEGLLQLQTTTGEEMDAIFLLHEAVKRSLNR